MQSYLSLALAWVSVVGSATAGVPISAREVYNVAIIGAGAAGSSAAYHLVENSKEAGLAVNVTIFEKTDRIGGRTLTVNAFGDPAIPVELGGSIFVGVNRIMTTAAERYNLLVKQLRDATDGDITAIWNGESFVFESAQGTSWWWDATKMWWKYGTAPYTAMKLVKSTVAKFLNLYERPHFPFRSLTQRVFELDLTKITGVTGEQFLADNKINADFSRDIIQAATRVNYASNLAYIHGLEAMVSMATDNAVSVVGGNWQIFDRMVRDSGAVVFRNTSVTDISFKDKKDKSSSRSKYVITTKQSNPDSAKAEAYPISFDSVVIANPWQYSDITAGEGVLKHNIDKIPYMKLHVTLFTSPFKLRPGYFNLPDGSKAPSNVYTTLKPAEEAKKGPDGVGSAGFYSVSTLSMVTNPKTHKREFLYKIFSPDVVTSEFLTDILGANVPSTFTASSEQDDATTQMVDPISWYYPHWFYAYPIELPRLTFQDPVLGDSLYYTSGIESFISCMETSALMGMNVAQLIADDFSELNKKYEESMGGFDTDESASFRNQEL